MRRSIPAQQVVDVPYVQNDTGVECLCEAIAVITVVTLDLSRYSTVQDANIQHIWY